MQIAYHKDFIKDLSKIRLQFVLDAVEERDKEIRECKSLAEFINLPSVTKLVNCKDYYRIKVGDYRIGVKIIDGIVHYSRFAIRSKIYQIFP